MELHLFTGTIGDILIKQERLTLPIIHGINSSGAVICTHLYFKIANSGIRVNVFVLNVDLRFCNMNRKTEEGEE